MCRLRRWALLSAAALMVSAGSSWAAYYAYPAPGYSTLASLIDAIPAGSIIQITENITDPGFTLNKLIYFEGTANQNGGAVILLMGSSNTPPIILKSYTQFYWLTFLNYYKNRDIVKILPSAKSVEFISMVFDGNSSWGYACIGDFGVPNLTINGCIFKNAGYGIRSSGAASYLYMRYGDFSSVNSCVSRTSTLYGATFYIDNCTFKMNPQNNGYCFKSQNGTIGSTSYSSTISNSYFTAEGTGSDPIWLQWRNQVYINNNTFKKCPGGVDWVKTYSDKILGATGNIHPTGSNCKLGLF